MMALDDQTLQDSNTVPAEFYTPDQAAAQIGRTTRTLQRWHSMRVGPPRTKIGSVVLYRKATFLAWLTAQEEEVMHRLPRVLKRRAI